jgi:cation transport ATPase
MNCGRRPLAVSAKGENAYNWFVGPEYEPLDTKGSGSYPVDPNEEPEAEQPSQAKVGQDLENFHKNQHIITLMALVMWIVVGLQVYAMFNISFTTSCYTIGMDWRSYTLTVFSYSYLAFILFAAHRLLQKDIYPFNMAVSVIFLIAVAIFLAWYFFDIFFGCTLATTEMAVWFFVATAIAELIVVIVNLVIFPGMQKSRNSLIEGWAALNTEQQRRLFTVALGGFSRYIKTIGSSIPV